MAIICSYARQKRRRLFIRCVFRTNTALAFPLTGLLPPKVSLLGEIPISILRQSYIVLVIIQRFSSQNASKNEILITLFMTFWHFTFYIGQTDQISKTAAIFEVIRTISLFSQVADDRQSCYNTKYIFSFYIYGFIFIMEKVFFIILLFLILDDRL